MRILKNVLSDKLCFEDLLLNNYNCNYLVLVDILMWETNMGYIKYNEKNTIKDGLNKNIYFNNEIFYPRYLM